jgi:hypothetical protein
MMLPLHVRLSASHRLLKSLTARFLWRGSIACLSLLCLGVGTGIGAQEKGETKEGTRQDSVSNPTAASKAVGAAGQASIHFRERPRYPTDPQRLRRTAQIDGVLTDGEWDPFYTISDGPIKGTIYCNWDDNYLYLAARTEGPANVLFDVDMGGDGWLRGADNLEIVVGSVADGGMPTVSARLLDAASSKDMPTWNETAVDSKTLVVAEKITNGTQVLEIAIPKNTASLVLRPGATIGIRAELMPPGPVAAFVPTAAFEPHLLLDAVLVEARTVAAGGINPRLTLSDYKCIPGQTLFATLELLNQTDLTVPIKSVLWTGNGNSANAVNTLREIAVAPLSGMKRAKLGYKTPLPDNLSVGSYMLTVTVELEGGKQVQSAASFTVVEPIQVQMSSTPDPVSIVGQTKLTVSVDVFSAVPNHFHGDVELTNAPSGWQLEGGKKRVLYIDREDSRRAVDYVLKLPSNTAAGDYPLEATVTWHKRTWKARTVAKVIRADAPAPTKP